MRTSNLLPAECREEIREEIWALNQVLTMIHSQGMRNICEMQLIALAWVLGDDGK